ASRRICGVVGSMPEGRARGSSALTGPPGATVRGAGALTGSGGVAGAACATVWAGGALSATTSTIGVDDAGGSASATTCCGVVAGVRTTTGENGLIVTR